MAIASVTAVPLFTRDSINTASMMRMTINETLKVETMTSSKTSITRRKRILRKKSTGTLPLRRDSGRCEKNDIAKINKYRGLAGIYFSIIIQGVTKQLGK